MIFTPGPIIGAASGSLGGLVASRNKGGPYIRVRAVPTTSTTAAALQAKAFLSEASAAFSGLTTIQQDSWTRYGTLKPEINRLGLPKILTGVAAHNRIYTRMRRAGLTPLVAPPIGSDPDAFATLTPTYDIGAGTSTLAFTPTPLGAAQHLWLKAAVVDSPGINYVEGIKRLVAVSAAALASPYDYQAAVEAVFGPLVVGQKLVLFPMIFDAATGLLSRPLRVEGVIVST